MTKNLIAVTVIHRTLEPGKAGDKAKGTRPVPPKVQVIAPKTRFQAADEDEYDYLIDAGAARVPTKADSGAPEVTDVPEGSVAKAEKVSKTGKGAKVEKEVAGAPAASEGQGSAGSGEDLV